MTLLEAYNNYCKAEFDNEPVDTLEFENDELGIACSDYYDEKSNREVPISTTWNRKTKQWCVYVDNKLISTEPMTEQELIGNLNGGSWDALIFDAYYAAEEIFEDD